MGGTKCADELLLRFAANSVATAFSTFSTSKAKTKRLGPGVNHFVAGFGVLRPERD